MSRLASLRAAASERRALMARRDSTQAGLWPRSRAMPLGVSLSSWASEPTTLASSSAVRVRGGALAKSSSRLFSMAEAGRSTTTGTAVAPCPRQRSRRLKPSRTSKPPSGAGATRSGSSASGSVAPWFSPGRSLAKVVRSCSMGSDRTVLICGAGMALPWRRSGGSAVASGTGLVSQSVRRVRTADR